MPLRPYDREQIFLLPPSLNQWMRHDHPAKVFSEIIDRMYTRLFREPEEEDSPAYQPKMMLKVLLRGYAAGVRSRRTIQACSLVPSLNGIQHIQCLEKSRMVWESLKTSC